MTLRSTLKQWFSRGNKPTAAQFAEWIDSFWHKSEDTIQMSDINMLPQTLNGKSDVGHTHDASEIRNLPSMTVDANIDPASTNPVENRAVSEALNGKANSNHQHGISDVNGLTQALNGKANTDHNHNDLYQPKGEYAPSDHEHSQYATNSAVQDLQEQIDLLAQGGADKKEVIAVSTYSDLTAISEPSQEVIYKTLDTNKLYLYNGRVYEDVTGVSIDNTIYVSDIAGLLTSEQEPGLYSVLVVTTTGNTTTVSATYSFAVTSVTRLLQNKDGWAERVTIGGSYQWSWHLYSYAGHNHDDAYAAKNHSHSQYLTQHQDISGKQDKTDNSLLTTVKTIVGAINELWNKFADYALSNHNHDGVYQPAGSYAAANHNHDGVYQPAGSYAAADHTHSQYLTQHQDISGKQDKTDNSLLTTVKTIVGAINELWNKFADYLKGIQHVTYAQLVTLRNNSGLVAGQWYRITDYMTTVANDTEARSAGHPFDLLVMATSSNTLSEEAKAIKSSRDSNGYFTDANLNAWKVWYSLDNDTTRFQWADTENGKGVIWRMIDEWQNDCPYDFKNVQFKRYKVTPTTPVPEDVEEQQLLTDLDGTYIGTNAEMQGLTVEDYDDFVWVYTFSFGDRLSTPVDASLMGYVNEEQGEGYGYKGYYGDNVILPCTCHQTVDDEQQSVFCLNNVVWITNNVKYRSLICGNRIESECINMTLSGHGTHIKHDCQNIIMGDGCLGNTIGVGCFLCTFGNYFQGNTFGNDCYENTFGNGCSGNTFGNDCRYNTFGNGCYWNTFGNNCRYITVHNGVQYVEVPGGSTVSAYVQNAQILNGTHGTDSSNLLQISFQEDADYCQFAGLNSSGNLRIWTPADAA